ncbi:MAG TPA: hypothetical protein DCG90_12480 [Sphingobium sp.]|jgi:hypothetical protein|nr:hypothetical protein [Sphingobium sp.]
MTLKQDLMIFGVTALLFVVCSVAMVMAHEELSRFPIVTYAFLGIYGVSAIGWPVFFIRSIRKLIWSAFSKRRS